MSIEKDIKFITYFTIIDIALIIIIFSLILSHIISESSKDKLYVGYYQSAKCNYTNESDDSQQCYNCISPRTHKLENAEDYRLLNWSCVLTSSPGISFEVVGRDER